MLKCHADLINISDVMYSCGTLCQLMYQLGFADYYERKIMYFFN
jgi:hypothetical protein